MFQTRRILKNRIQELEEELKKEKELNRRTFASKLPPCKNPACAVCKYSFRYYIGTSTYTLGCLKGIDCEHFEILEPRQNGFPIRCYNANQVPQSDEEGGISRGYE